MAIPKSLASVAARVEETFRQHGVKLTLGGEPTYVPVDPSGPEWSITALGPTKLRYAYTLADALMADTLATAVPILSPGKFYPGEVNARWSLNLLWNRDGTPLVPAKGGSRGAPAAGAIEAVQRAVTDTLVPGARWMRGVDPAEPARPIAVLPLDHDDERFVSADWGLGETIELTGAEGAAGLRLPLQLVPAELNRRALTIEIKEGKLHVFLPPLRQAPVLAIIDCIAAVPEAGTVIWEGYIPWDEGDRWQKFALAADPGVLEINLPPCSTWSEYARWMELLERCAKVAGLRSFKRHSPEDEAGTGGGNHLLFGGPSLDENPLFTHPRWITSILRYWQHHPSLAYLFTGVYVGPSSQAPRPDECVSSLYDLEMAYRFLEQLPEGDHRYLISETLRHLHTDSSGNTHRSESSFDKFWNVNFDGGCRGLVEFRAIESLPRADWMSAVALLWLALAAHLLEHPFTEPLVAHGERLHDWFYLPGGLWADFESILGDLAAHGFALPREIYGAIRDWRFPVMLECGEADALLTVRRGHEGWPLLCEQPLEGGNTSRFVDTSIERVEFLANAAFARTYELRVQGRQLALEKLPDGQFGVGLRYRRSALYPSLHPGIPPHLPLLLTIAGGGATKVFKLEPDRRKFERTETDSPPPPAPNPCRKLNPELHTCDLRLP